MAQLYYAYIIESESTRNWYYGSSQDPYLRLSQHNANTNISTKRRGPWKLIFVRAFVDKKEALAFEKQLKKWRNKNFIQSQFKEYFI
ncbi:MAG: GIY-YIG nuclease family protein [Sphingobacteriales bacterium]|nr:GIY-YIG nuclease family protein [Sphingobacteriales bacterium]